MHRLLRSNRESSTSFINRLIVAPIDGGPKPADYARSFTLALRRPTTQLSSLRSVVYSLNSVFLHLRSLQRLEINRPAQAEILDSMGLLDASRLRKLDVTDLEDETFLDNYRTRDLASNGRVKSLPWLKQASFKHLQSLKIMQMNLGEGQELARLVWELSSLKGLHLRVRKPDLGWSDSMTNVRGPFQELMGSCSGECDATDKAAMINMLAKLPPPKS